LIQERRWAIMKVKEIMKHPVITVNKEATIKECGTLLEDHDINGAPVMEGERVVGVITRTDIFKSILPRYSDLYEDEKFLMDFEYIEGQIHKVNQIKVHTLMGTPAITLDQDTPICKAGSLMIWRRIKQIPVLSHNKLVGIITLTDICKNLMQRAGSDETIVRRVS
jgi:CBS domain-containing protein